MRSSVSALRSGVLGLALEERRLYASLQQAKAYRTLPTDAERFDIVEQAVLRVFAGRMFDKDYCVEFYRKHVARVCDEIPSAHQRHPATLEDVRLAITRTTRTSEGVPWG